MTLSICICTLHRPGPICLALQSIGRSTQPVHEVIVSDDSADDATQTAVAAFEHVHYYRGPRRGLSANRNAAIDHATGSHILYLDDDALLGSTFVEAMQREVSRRGPTSIITGVELRHGRHVVLPQDQDFLGFQTRPYRSVAGIHTVAIGSTIFPRSIFRSIQFDEHLTYGYEEVDFAVRADAAGYTIYLAPDAINDHYPSSANRQEYAEVTDSSRLYITFKRYAWVERRRGRALAFAIIGPAHLIARSTFSQGLPGLVASLRTLRRAIAYATDFRRAS